VVRRKFKDCTTDEEREEFKKKIEEEKKKLHDIPTISLETKVTIPNSGEELKLKFPESRQKRDYKNLNFTYLLALEKEIKWEEEKLCAKNCQVDPTRKLAYILKYRAIHKYYLNHVGSYAGPYDKPISLPTRLGNEVISFRQYTEFKHDPETEHFKFCIDEKKWEGKNVNNAIESLTIDCKLLDSEEIAGPVESYGKTWYTCESGKCKIPCLCSMCTKGDESLCKTHTSVDEVVSGFYSEYDAFTVRSHDSFDLYMNTNVTDFGLSTIKDRKRELGRNEYCIRPSCRSSGGSILSRCEARDKIIQCKKTKKLLMSVLPFLYSYRSPKVLWNPK